MTHPDLPSPGFPAARPRRLRYNPLVRDLVRETEEAVARLAGVHAS